MSNNNYSTVNGSLPVPSDDGERTIGIIEHGVFTKSSFNSSKHICHKHHAIGLDIGSFKNFIKPNANLIVCTDKKKNITYSISTDKFKSHAFADNLGWGVQLFCPLEHWETSIDSGNPF